MADTGGIEYQRKHARETVHSGAEIRIGEAWHGCKIINISTGGAKLKTDRNIDRGTAVLLKIGNFGQFRAAVVWNQRDTVGVEFAHDPSEMATVIMGMASYG